MPKYRLLSLQELESLQKEFIDFLVVNGIVAADWEKMKAAEPGKAEKIVELFSDVVMEGVLRKIEFIEVRTKKHFFTYQCLSEKIVLMGIEGTGEADFTDAGFLRNATSGAVPDLRIFTTEKKYSKPREQELFEMLQNGHAISDGRLFKALALSLADQQ